MLPSGTPSPDWRWLYAVNRNLVQVVDSATGAVAAQTTVPDWAAAVRTSANGRWLVFAGSTAAGSTTSRFEVQDAALAKPPETVTLRGSFSFDGISNDGRRLYLLEWVSAGRYWVRRYDLPQRRLYQDPIVEKSESPGPMSGQAAMGVATRDGATQLTLYQHDANHLSFVHVLPLTSDSPFAFCVDLPGPDHGWTLVAAPNGRTFYAVNPGYGWIVTITATAGAEPTVTKSRIDETAALQAGAADTPPAVVGPDGSTLYLSDGRRVVSVSTRTMRPTGSPLVVGSSITSLAFDPTGGVLYALEPGRLLALDPRVPRVLRSVSLPPGVTFVAIMRVV
jgi:DNA-binding beta-propeller fold protein YncE